MFPFQNFAIIPKEIETILMQTFEGKTKSSTVFLKKAYWIKQLLLVFWQKPNLYQWGRLKQKRFLSDANRPEVRDSDDLLKNLGKTTAQ